MVRLKSSSRRAKIVCLGLDGAGKTSILNRVAEHHVLQHIPTRGCDVVQLDVLGFKLAMHDVGGSVPDRQNWLHYCTGAHAILFVIDATDYRRLEQCGVVLQRILEADVLAGVPLLVLANKQDVVNSLSMKDISDGLNLHLTRGRAWQIRESSARTGQGLHAAFGWLVSTLHKVAAPLKEQRRTLRRMLLS